MPHSRVRYRPVRQQGYGVGSFYQKASGSLQSLLKHFKARLNFQKNLDTFTSLLVNTTVNAS